jgi:hypothetical protein
MGCASDRVLHPTEATRGRAAQLLGDCTHGQIPHRLDTECVGDPVEEGEHGGNVDGFCDLLLRPARRPKRIGVGPGYLVRLEGDLAGKF